MGSLPQPVRLYYIAPMFRYDRPQKGRYRMHYQFGAEVLGSAAPAADVEVLSLPIRLIQTLGLTEVQVRLNSVGDPVCRPAYVEALRKYFRPYRDQLCEDCQRRLEVNPMRILECKEPGCHAIAAGAHSAAEIGARLKAGTNCGSCIPELKRLIAQNAAEQPQLAAVS